MKTIEEIRREVDRIDDEVIFLLEKRFDLVSNMEKQKNNLTDKEREEFILNKTSSKYVKEVYKKIFFQSKKLLFDKITLEEQLK